MTRYRFLDGMGDVVAEHEFADHAEALAWVMAEDGPDDEVQRVEYLGPEGERRWPGALHDGAERPEQGAAVRLRLDGALRQIVMTIRAAAVARPLLLRCVLIPTIGTLPPSAGSTRPVADGLWGARSWA